MYFVTGTSVNIEVEYKPHGVKIERYALLREDIFDMLMISAPPSLLPWTTERETFLRQFYPSFPIPSNQNCTSFSTIDTSSIRESPQLHVTRPMNQISFKPSATNTLSSPTFQTMIRRQITHSNMLRQFLIQSCYPTILQMYRIDN